MTTYGNPVDRPEALRVVGRRDTLTNAVDYHALFVTRPTTERHSQVAIRHPDEGGFVENRADVAGQYQPYIRLGRKALVRCVRPEAHRHECRGNPRGAHTGAPALSIATKPAASAWRQLCGAGALGGSGFTMFFLIAGVVLSDPADYAAAKIAIFLGH